MIIACRLVKFTIRCSRFSLLHFLGWSEFAEGESALEAAEVNSMTIHVALHHRTVYRYDRPVSLGPQTLRLRPAPHCRTPILAYSLSVQPKDHFINWQQDPYSNYQARLVFPEKTRELVIEVDLVADLAVTNPFDFFLEPSAETYPFAYDETLTAELVPYREVAPAGPLLKRWLAAVEPGPRQTTEFLVALNIRLQHDIGYVIRMEPGVQSCEETLGLRKGSCRDTAFLLVEILRHLGLAARFVSGYIYSPHRSPAHRGRIGGGHTHAWVRVYLPACGWVEFDPTNGIVGNADLVRVAVARDPRQAVPLHGTWAGLPTDYLGMDVEVDVHAEIEGLGQLSARRAVAVAG
jgi:transglutaminase-like putative cysteine protease